MLNASTSPHIRSGSSTATIMRDVTIAMLPAMMMGIFVFGLRALVVTLISVAVCVLTEWLYQRLMKLPVTIADGSAVVTGLILAMNLPASVPVYVPVIGGVVAILVIKQLFGGIGQNLMNPALGARCFLLICFPALLGGGMPAVGNLFGNDSLGDFVQRMTTWQVDAVATATPLAALKAGEDVDVLQVFLGLHSGCIGEISAAAILLGAVYMLARGVITLRIPGTYLISTLGFIFLFNLLGGRGVTGYETLLGHLLTGGLMAGAVFMATDYTTRPITPAGQVVYALLMGFLTALFRVYGSSPEGVSYAIVIANCLVPLIEKATMPHVFGVPRKKGGAA